MISQLLDPITSVWTSVSRQWIQPKIEATVHEKTAQNFWLCRILAVIVILDSDFDNSQWKSELKIIELFLIRTWDSWLCCIHLVPNMFDICNPNWAAYVDGTQQLVRNRQPGSSDFFTILKLRPRGKDEQNSPQSQVEPKKTSLFWTLAAVNYWRVVCFLPKPHRYPHHHLFICSL